VTEASGSQGGARLVDTALGDAHVLAGHEGTGDDTEEDAEEDEREGDDAQRPGREGGAHQPIRHMTKPSSMP
jgi:hypothetical protein